MKSRVDLPFAILLGGSGALAVWAAVRLPPPRDLASVPATPYEHSRLGPAVIPVFQLLSRATAAIPAGASVVLVAEPRDAVRETALHNYAVALLADRRVLPSAAWDAFTPQYEAEAEYVIVLGPTPARAPGALVGTFEGGTVWRREPGAAR